MVAKVSLDEQLLQQLRQAGELQVEDPHGERLVLMTVDARQQLHKVEYDDSEWTEAEMMAVAAEALNDPEGWGAPEMDDYDKVYGGLFNNDEQNT